jgi:hypothetical protein
MAVKHLFFCILGSLSICACGPAMSGRSQREAESARIDRLMAQVHNGDSRKEVERTLGRPYNVERNGRETVMIYLTGPERTQQDTEASRRASANIGMLSSMIGALGSYGGSNLGQAGSIGSQVLSAGGSMNSGSSGAPSSEQTRIEVRLRGDKVVSIERLDSGRMGIGADY